MELFEHGLFYLKQKDVSPVEIKRGMATLTEDKEEAGQVAAVIFDKDNNNVSHLLLSPQSQISDYRVVAVKLIKQVVAETVILCIASEAIENLPYWQENKDDII